MRRRRLAVVVLACCALVGCTPSRGAEPTPVITPANPTPAETEFERQRRLNLEAAEKAYREFRAEYRRVQRAGGAAEATPTMKKTAADDYLSTYTRIVQSYRDLSYELRGDEKIVYVNMAEYPSATRLALAVCEDGRLTATYNAQGKLVGRGELRAAKLELRKTDGQWRIWVGTGKKVSACPAT